MLDPKELLSDTQRKIVKIYPEGSSPTKKEVQELYIKTSKSNTRLKKSAKYPNSRLRSVKQSRMKKANALYKWMIKVDYWTIKE